MGVTDRYPVVTGNPIIGVITWDWGDYDWRIEILRNISNQNIQDDPISGTKIIDLLQPEATVE